MGCINSKNVKPIEIIGISVVCSMVAVLLVLAISDKIMPSEEEQALEETYKKQDEQNQVFFESFEKSCYETPDGEEQCLREMETVKQAVSESLAADKQAASERFAADNQAASELLSP